MPRTVIRIAAAALAVALAAGTATAAQPVAEKDFASYFFLKQRLHGQ